MGNFSFRGIAHGIAGLVGVWALLQSQAVSPELVRLHEVEAQMKAIDKWDGHLPNVTGGAVPFISVGAMGEGKNK